MMMTMMMDLVSWRKDYESSFVTIRTHVHVASLSHSTLELIVYIPVVL